MMGRRRRPSRPRPSPRPRPSQPPSPSPRPSPSPNPKPHIHHRHPLTRWPPGSRPRRPRRTRRWRKCGVEGCGGHPRPAMGPGCPGWPPTPKPGHPPPRCPGESGLDSPVLLQRVHHRLLGVGWVWVDGGGGVVHLDKPLRLGVVKGWWVWQQELPGKKWGETPPPPPPRKWG